MVLDDLVPCPEEERRSAEARLRKRYRYADLFAKREAALQDLRHAVEQANIRTGKRYIIDFQRTEDFFDLEPRGKYYRLAGEGIFLNGIEDLAFGAIIMSTEDSPVVRPWPWAVEWIDTEAKEGDMGYELSSKEQQGSVYKNVVVRTRGVALGAPEVRIMESGDSVRIIILKKA